MKRDDIERVFLTLFILVFLTIPFANADDGNETGRAAGAPYETEDDSVGIHSLVRENGTGQFNETPAPVPYIYVPPPVEPGKSLSATADTTATESYEYVRQWGTSGSGNGQFHSPAGLLVDNTGNVYVADHYGARVQKFSPDGTYISQFGTGTYGSGDGQMQNPWGVAEDLSHYIYVTDAGNNARVQKYNAGGTFITQWGTPGTGNGQFSFPTGVASDSSGKVYVAGYYNQRIQKFSSDGIYETAWGSYGTGDGQFNHLHGVAVDASDNVYIVDFDNNRIQKFSETGEYITKWGSFGTASGQFNGPIGIGLDAAGNVYVADTYNHRIQKFDSNGTYLTQWGTYGSGNGQFSRPHGVGVDSSGMVYVTDFDNHRVQVFRQVAPVANFTGAPTSGTVPLLVWFTDLSTGSPTTWSWDFGDGLTETKQNPYHVYTNVTNGPYTVSLTVMNEYGENTKVKQNYVTLVVPTPTAITVPTTGPIQKPQKTYKMYAEVGTYSTIDSAKGFWDTMNGASNKGITWTPSRDLIVKTNGCLNNNDCPAASHWTSDAPQWIGQADFLFYSGHGGRGSLWFEDDNGLYAIAEDMGLDSTGKTKWVVFDSCDTMYNGADSTYSRWIPQFDNGLHMLLGWHTNVDYQSNGASDYRGLVFAKLMQGKYNDGRTHTMRDAWYLTGLNNYQDRPPSHISHDTWNAVMYWNGCENDYLPGWNKFCINPGASGRITWEPRFIVAQDNFGRSGSFSSTLTQIDDTYSLAASVPVTKEKAVIYKPVKSGYSKEQASSLAKSLGMSGDIRETDDAFYTDDSDAEQFLFSVQKNSSMILFRNNNPSSGTRQTKQSDAQVISAANVFLRKNNLMPPGELEPRTVNNSIITYTRSGTVINERKTYAVVYPLSIDGLPVFNAQFNVEVDSDGNVIGLFKNWRDYEPIRKITLKSPEEAFGEFKTHPPKSKTIIPEKVNITGVSLGYSIQTSADGEEYLQPVYIFEGSNQRGNSVEPFEPVIINAKKEEKR